MQLSPALGAEESLPAPFVPLRVSARLEPGTPTDAVVLWTSDPSAGVDARAPAGEWGAVPTALADDGAHEAFLVPWSGPIELTARAGPVWAAGPGDNLRLVPSPSPLARLPAPGSEAACALRGRLLRALRRPRRLAEYTAALLAFVVGDERLESALTASDWLDAPENASRLLRWLFAPSAAAAAQAVAALRSEAAGQLRRSGSSAIGLARLLSLSTAPPAADPQPAAEPQPPSPRLPPPDDPAPALRLYAVAADENEPALVDALEALLPHGPRTRQAVARAAVPRFCSAAGARAQMTHTRAVELLVACGCAAELLDALAGGMLDSADQLPAGAPLAEAPDEFAGALRLLEMLLTAVRRSETPCRERVRVLARAAAATEALLGRELSYDGALEAAVGAAALSFARVHDVFAVRAVRAVLRHWRLDAPVAVVVSQLTIVQCVLSVLSSADLLAGAVGRRLVATVARCVRSESAQVACAALELACAPGVVALAGPRSGLDAALAVAAEHWDGGVARAAADAFDVRRPRQAPPRRRCKNRFCEMGAGRCLSVVL